MASATWWWPPTVVCLDLCDLLGPLLSGERVEQRLALLSQKSVDVDGVSDAVRGLICHEPGDEARVGVADQDDVGEFVPSQGGQGVVDVGLQVNAAHVTVGVKPGEVDGVHAVAASGEAVADGLPGPRTRPCAGQEHERLEFRCVAVGVWVHEGLPCWVGRFG